MRFDGSAGGRLRAISPSRLKARLRHEKQQRFAQQELADPVLWAENRFGRVWSKQREILRAVEKYRRVAVRSCHSSGKSRIAAVAALRHLGRYPAGEALVITTSHRSSQVRTVLWKEIGTLFDDSGIQGRCNQTEIQILVRNPRTKRSREKIAAFGYRPDDTDESAFQGHHARYTMILLDEAAQIPEPIWIGADSIMASGTGCILAIGNPTHPNTPFHRCFQPNSLYHQIHISAFMTPNFNPLEAELLKAEGHEDLLEVVTQPHYVDDMKRLWGEDNPNYRARILGEFPDSIVFGFFPDVCIEAARSLVFAPEGRPILGCDIGGGRDANVVYERRKCNLRRIHKDYEVDPEVTGKKIVELMDKRPGSIAIIDHRGIGKEAYEYANGKRAGRVFGCGFGDEAKDKLNYHDRKAELYTTFRDRLVDRDVDIDERIEDLIEDMRAIKGLTDSKGRIQIESKEATRKVLKRSPDDLDAAALTFGYAAPIGMPLIVGPREGGSWGS